MAQVQLAGVLRHLRRLIGNRTDTEADGQLLRRFVTDRDEAAFAELVRRHGPMVLGLCRRILGDPHEADDAFQATFLVLVKKAGSLDQWGSLGNWLYTVAYHLALKARASASRRRTEERQVEEVPQVPAETEVWRELWPLLDGEINRLPAKYRAPVVLCYLEGKTNEEAARDLGWPAGTVKCRLARARELLRKRLGKRGLAGGVILLGPVLTEQALPAVSPVVLEMTTRTAALFAAGEVAAAGAIAFRAVCLANGALHGMFISPLRSFVALVLFLALAGAGSATLLRSGDGSPTVESPTFPLAAVPEVVAEKKNEPPALEPLAKDPPKDAVTAKVTAVDADSGQVTISAGKNDGLEKGHTLEVYRLKPKPIYIGQLRIIQVYKATAIGKTSHRRKLPAVGDEVTIVLPREASQKTDDLSAVEPPGLALAEEMRKEQLGVEEKSRQRIQIVNRLVSSGRFQDAYQQALDLQQEQISLGAIIPPELLARLKHLAGDKAPSVPPPAKEAAKNDLTQVRIEGVYRLMNAGRIPEAFREAAALQADQVKRGVVLSPSMAAILKELGEQQALADRNKGVSHFFRRSGGTAGQQGKSQEQSPRVNVRSQNKTLAALFDELSMVDNVNLALDPRVANQLKTRVTLHINQVPVETAARLLADMAGLRVIKLDSVLYVTSKENATALEKTGK